MRRSELAAALGGIFFACSSGPGSSAEPPPAVGQVDLSEDGTYETSSAYLEVQTFSGSVRLGMHGLEEVPEGTRPKELAVQVDLSRDESRMLGSEQPVALRAESGTVSYGELSEGGYEAVRLLDSLELTAQPDHTVVLVVSLGTEVDLPDVPNTPLGTAAELRYRGTLAVTCVYMGTSGVVADPLFAAEECRTALDDYGLRALHEAQR